jgi:hypothetical protein
MPSLARRIQERLCRTYGIEGAPPVDDFIEPTDGPAREALLVRDTGDGIELSLRLPRRVLEASEPASLDDLCQVVEGVSHFLYIVERARRELPTTCLELELQAEIDKYVLLVPGGLLLGEGGRGYEPERASRIRRMLFEQVTFAHPEGTETGDRYRMANSLAARFAGRLEESFIRRGLFDQMRSLLRRFDAAGQAEKLTLARAA